MSLILSS